MYSNTRFQQLLEVLPRSLIEKTSQRLQADRYDKTFSPYRHLVALIYAQLSGARSLREVETGFNAHTSHHYHLGVQPIKRSTLSDANQRRNPRLFQALTEHLMQHIHRKQRRELRELCYLLDSSPIQLKGRGFNWAEAAANYRTQGLKVHMMIEREGANPVYLNITDPRVNDISDALSLPLEAGACYVFDKGYYSFNWWHRIDEAGSQFVTRFKKNAGLIRIESLPVSGEGIVADERVMFKHRSNRAGHHNAYYGKALRRVTVEREGKPPLVLATNDLDSPAEVIAERYRQRWQIELFFKWIKQNLKVKQFLGRSRNAVVLQIYAAIISYLLVWIHKRRAGVSTSLHLLLTELRCTLLERIGTERQRWYRQQRRLRQTYIQENQHALAL